MKRLFLLFILFQSGVLIAQDQNIFLDRDFWKTDPTVKTIKQKIKEGHDPAEKNDFGFDAISYGLLDNISLPSLKYLLKQEGNPVTKPTHGGITYLLWAAYKGNVEAVNLLLDAGSDPMMANSSGTNMLLMAAIGGVDNPAMYELILSQGISKDYRNQSGANALLLLSGSQIENLKVFDYLLSKGFSLDSKDSDGNNLFSYAARGGSLEIMKMWQDKGVSYDGLNKKGENVVLFAAQGMKRRALRMEVFNYLTQDLDLEADVVSWEGKTPLHYAARRADKELIQFLIEEGVSTNQIDESGELALFNAIGKDMEKLQLFVDLAKNINHANKDGHSALTRAIRWRSKESFDLLISSGADAKIVDIENNNLLYHAFDAYRKRNEETVAYFIDQLSNADIEAKGQFAGGNTLAHIAVERQSPFLLKKALAMGVFINTKNDLNLTPLHLAAMKATDNELLTLLVENGADKKSRTDLDESAYDLAAQNELLQENNVNYAILRLE